MYLKIMSKQNLQDVCDLLEVLELASLEEGNLVAAPI